MGSRTHDQLGHRVPYKVCTTRNGEVVTKQPLSSVQLRSPGRMLPKTKSQTSVSRQRIASPAIGSYYVAYAEFQKMAEQEMQ